MKNVVDLKLDPMQQYYHDRGCREALKRIEAERRTKLIAALDSLGKRFEAQDANACPDAGLAVS